MRFIIFLLLCAQSVVSVLTSMHSPDLQNRDQGVNYYNVFPTAHKHYAMLIETGIELAKLCGEVATMKFPNKTVALWKAVSKDSQDILQDLRAVKGVRLVERADSSWNTIPDSEAPKLARQQLDEYVVLVEDGSDVVKIENFLKTQIQKGTSYYPMELEDEILGWGGVVLDGAAQEAVKAYEGVLGITVDEDASPYTRERSPSVRSISETPAHGDLAVSSDAVEGARSVDLDVAAHDTARVIDARDPDLSRRDVESCSCLLKNTSDVHEVEEFLKSKIQGGSKYYPHKRGDKVYGFWDLALDAEAQKAVKEYNGIEYFKIGMQKMTPYLALPHAERSTPVRAVEKAFEEKSQLLPRAGDWVKQTTDDEAMKMISQYPGADINKLTDYVYPRDAGDGVNVYVIDRGVQIGVTNKQGELEFRHVNDKEPLHMEVLQTYKSAETGQQYYDDDDTPIPHGTGIASRAVGKHFGVAKEATIIPVKLSTLDDEELPDALELIRLHLLADPARQRKSVVMSAIGWSDSYFGGRDTPEAVKDAYDLQAKFGEGYRDIMDLGVPIVVAAGNMEGQPDINCMPQLLADDDTPFIVVGAAENDGSRVSDSQGGSQLTMYGPGAQSPMQGKKNGEHFIAGGTSLATPHVAGVIATYLGYTQKPWDDSKTGRDRVREIKRYITSKESSWERQPGINVIWNGATEEDHRNAGANGLNTPTPPKDKALTIIYQETVDDTGHSYAWLFFGTKFRESPLCYSQGKGKVVSTEVKMNEGDLPPWPVGSFRVDNLFGRSCEYKNDGKDNAGMLWCDKAGGGQDGIACRADEMRTTKKVKYCSEAGLIPLVSHIAVVSCEW